MKKRVEEREGDNPRQMKRVERKVGMRAKAADRSNGSSNRRKKRKAVEVLDPATMLHLEIKLIAIRKHYKIKKKQPKGQSVIGRNRLHRTIPSALSMTSSITLASNLAWIRTSGRNRNCNRSNNRNSRKRGRNSKLPYRHRQRLWPRRHHRPRMQLLLMKGLHSKRPKRHSQQPAACRCRSRGRTRHHQVSRRRSLERRGRLRRQELHNS